MNALETAGGIIHELPLLGNAPFLVINADIACDFPVSSLINANIDLAHLVLIKNPKHHPDGDFGLENNLIKTQATEKFTFSGIGIYRPELFANMPHGKSKLAPILRSAAQNNRVSGELHHGFWMDIGTPERLKELEKYYNSNN